ncbi:MAG TPA: hypothetical protein PLS10_06440 [Chitinophagales bacterium]|nr:hypothetical protein [Chitinophagales bacterium]
MLKSKLLLLTVIASVTLVSCKKESLITNSVLPSPSDARVKTKTEGNNVETYYYDSQNRLSKIVFSSTNGTSYYYEYTYSNGTVYEYRSNEPRYEQEQALPNGAVKQNCTSNPGILKLNKDGFYTGAASYCQSKSYTYDSRGFITEENYSMTDYNRIDQLVYDNKNVVQIISKGYSYGGAEFSYITTFQYLTGKPTSIGNINFGREFLGNSSEDLVKSVTENGKTTDYLYELDAQQRVINKTTRNNKEETVTTYTYY